MGSVFLAEDEMLGRQVALKTLNRQFTVDPQLIERFRTEARAQAGITHANIVTLHSFFKEQEDYVMVLEFARGKTLRQLLAEKKIFTEDELTPVFLQLLDGLGYAHSMGVVHRDIKPSNIIIDEVGNLKILDFGIAKILGDKNLTGTGTKLGTINYMSPEQVRGQKDIDQRTDIYSLAVLIYEMLTGRLPINTDSDSEYDILKEIVEGTVINPKALQQNISDKLNSVLLRMLDKKKEGRYPTCLQAKEDLFNGNSASRIYQPQVKIETPSVKINRDSFEPEMIFVEGGRFLMGSDDGGSDEKPVHTVRLSDFYIGKYPVTQMEWELIMNNHPSIEKGDLKPVDSINWNTAQEFVNILSAKTGKKYRLPTEAQWEYAARGGNKSKNYLFSGSNNINDVAWHCDNSESKRMSVGGKEPNELGIYDMSGNIWEWCFDWYDSKYYKHSKPYNPHGPNELGFFCDKVRVIRGGSSEDNEAFCRSTHRDWSYPNSCSYKVGFRIIYTP